MESQTNLLMIPRKLWIVFYCGTEYGVVGATNSEITAREIRDKYVNTKAWKNNKIVHTITVLVDFNVFTTRTVIILYKIEKRAKAPMSIIAVSQYNSEYSKNIASTYQKMVQDTFLQKYNFQPFDGMHNLTALMVNDLKTEPSSIEFSFGIATVLA